jgi:hypothetical protein
MFEIIDKLEDRLFGNEATVSPGGWSCNSCTGGGSGDCPPGGVIDTPIGPIICRVD